MRIRAQHQQQPVYGHSYLHDRDNRSDGQHQLGDHYGTSRTEGKRWSHLQQIGELGGFYDPVSSFPPSGAVKLTGQRVLEVVVIEIEHP
jgi:hypothetical protein